MSDASVTPGPLGGISARTAVYTAQQVDSLLDAVTSLVSGVTTEGWATIADIVSGAENLATKDDLAALVQYDSGSGEKLLLGSGVQSGYGVASGVWYRKNGSLYGPEDVRLLDEAMFKASGFSCGEEVVQYAWEAKELVSALGRHLSGASMSGAGELIASACKVVSGLELGSGGNAGGDAYDALSRILRGASSSSGSIAFLPNGATDFCDGVQSCVSGCGFVTAQQLSGMGFVTATDLSGLTDSLSGLNAAVCGLRSATCGISMTLSGMADAISGLPDKIVEAIDSAPLLTEEVKEKAKAAVLPAVRDMNQTLNAKKDDIADGLAAVANALDDHDSSSVDSVSEALSEVSEATEAVDLSEASETASSGAEDASSAATAASNESTTIEALPGFVP